jgi:glutaminyl-tRNA synthetase
MENSDTTGFDFIRTRVIEDNASGRYDGRVQTRFPPEPNGYLHIGHAKAISLDFGIAQEFGGKCKLRFDDTNPAKEDEEYVKSIKEDVAWLGHEWEDVVFASDYFEQLYEWAVQLIRDGKAYVDSQTAAQITENRGTPTSPGVDSPYRSRTAEENLDLFEKMRGGEFPDGTHVLRAKIDMAHPNLNMRDPVMYRILHARHHRTGDTWCIYPLYDWAHGQSDALEKVTHSICTLEFENHRPLYEWYIAQLGIFPSSQIEFAPLNPSYTMLSKRRLRALVEERLVDGWDDPRMPTIAGLRRRGYTPGSIAQFLRMVGVSKTQSIVDIGLLDLTLREELNKTARRLMAVLDPVKVVITNYPEDKTENFRAQNNPEDPDAGEREIVFSREIWIERSDFMEDPPKKFFRLSPGKEVRLKHAYYITCDEVVRDESGQVAELRCSYDPESRGGETPDGRKVKGTLQWVSAAHSAEVQVRLFDRLFVKEEMNTLAQDQDFRDLLNPDSLKVIENARAEAAVADLDPGTRVQFLRHGYFCADAVDSRPGAPVMNRITGLRDTWAKLQKK